MNVKPHKVGDLERATFTNIEEQNIDHVVDSLMPWMERIEQEIDLQLVDEPDIYAKHNVKAFLRGKEEDRAKALQIRRLSGTLNADEWREIEDENPLPDGIGKSYWMPVNYTISPTPAEAEQQVDPTAPPQLTSVKSAALRCQSCNQLLAELATPPYRFTCRHCKQVTEAAA